ncbi:transposase [Streptomyces brasiliscabiei]|uniref:transposase n=1 Tax=Streptomyces brasiliscabiei TaxID=2736302 RepID=UPI0038F76435
MITRAVAAVAPVRLLQQGIVALVQGTDPTHVLAAVRDLTRLELTTEAFRAALQEVAGISPHLLDDLVDEDWGRRYGRPVRLGKNPAKPKTRILATGNDAVRLLEHLYRHGADRALGPSVQALRQIMVQRTTSPTAAPLTVARFTKSQCQPCPARAQCTASREGTRTVGFPPRELRDLQLRVRTKQQTPESKTRYAVRSGVEGTVNEFAHGHGMRHCRCRGQGKAHIQHILTAIAVNIERLSGLPPHRGNPHAPPAGCLPEPPRPARDTPAEVLANPRHLTSATPRSPTESSSAFHAHPILFATHQVS